MPCSLAMRCRSSCMTAKSFEKEQFFNDARDKLRAIWYPLVNIPPDYDRPEHLRSIIGQLSSVAKLIERTLADTFLDLYDFNQICLAEYRDLRNRLSSALEQAVRLEQATGLAESDIMALCTAVQQCQSALDNCEKCLWNTTIQSTLESAASANSIPNSNASPPALLSHGTVSQGVPMPNPKDIEAQRKLLDQYRHNLAFHLQQQADQGGLLPTRAARPLSTHPLRTGLSVRAPKSHASRPSCSNGGRWSMITRTTHRSASPLLS
jgi:hypothetical protein